jgi:hypothetical protein
VWNRKVWRGGYGGRVLDILELCETVIEVCEQRGPD